MIKISANLFSMKDTIRHTTQLSTAIKRFFNVVLTQTVLEIEKSAGFHVVASLITVIESVCKYELAMIAKKLLG